MGSTLYNSGVISIEKVIIVLISEDFPIFHWGQTPLLTRQLRPYIRVPTGVVLRVNLLADMSALQFFFTILSIGMAYIILVLCRMLIYLLCFFLRNAMLFVDK